MKKYRKVTEMEVLKKCYEIELEIDYAPIGLTAHELNTSKYQIQKIYRSLKEQGYMKIEKVCTYADEYWNGLYDEAVPILHAKVYMLTNKARELLRTMMESKPMNVGDKVIADGKLTEIIAQAYDDNGTKVYMVKGSMKDYYENELTPVF